MGWLLLAGSLARPQDGLERGTPRTAWQEALLARQRFEAEPPQEHTRAAFDQVVQRFRAIYHGNPADPHAPAAVEQVAELLAEQGGALSDRKALRAAAGQYEFLATQYPASALGGPALRRAVDLLGPKEANDPTEQAKARALLDRRSPRNAAGKAPQSGMQSGMQSGVQSDMQSGTENAHGTAATAPARADRSGDATPVRDTELTPPPASPGDRAPAVVTGIRHWSTANYTRVAIDLGGEVAFQAARVERPDRIFFDLHGARLAPGLVGKTFSVTDNGFLKTIRAAQAGGDLTRVVLDVAPVAEYSAFLLPNPYRLIIDIHGRETTAASTAAPTAGSGARPSKASAEQPPAPVDPSGDAKGAGVPAPGRPSGPEAPRSAAQGAAVPSTLPPMPVTDGSAGFGLPPKRDQATAGNSPVARARVVVPATPTATRPVPNAVSVAAPESTREVAAVSDRPGVVVATAHPTRNPVVDRAPGPTAGAQPKEAASPTGIATPATPAPPIAQGRSTLTRALGLKIGRIVIDAGHGGHDSGTLGPGGIEEKDVVLDVSLRLGKLLRDRLGAEVVYTRADDTFVPLETRTAIANKAQADLFLSVHANSSPDPGARGVEVFYLNFTSDPEAMQVASRENAVSSQRVNQLSDLVKKIALKDKIDESRELAADVDSSLYAGLKGGNAGLKDRGVKKAPFVVLIGANMPSILAEISFVTNPDDADKLSRPEYRERVAESLYNGVARYASGMNGAKSKATERAQR